MSVRVCNSPKFEMSNESSSYFGNLHNMPTAGYMTPSEKQHSSGYFDLVPRPSSTSTTTYFDAPKTNDTPFYDCEQTPFFEKQETSSNSATNSPPTSTINNNTNFNNNSNNSVARNHQSTPGLQMKLSASFQDGMITPSWVTTGALKAKLPQTIQRSKKPSGLSPLTPANFSFEAFSVDTVAELLRRHQAAPQHLLILVLDLRSFSHFTKDRVKTALNICIPSTLLRRCSFSTDKILDMLASDDDRNIFQNWPNFENILVYDNDLDTMSDNCSILHVCKKFKAQNCKAKIGWLKGGFNAFSEKYPDMCEQMESGPPLSSTFPRRRSTTGEQRGLRGPFTCPTPITEITGVNPFFSNIRQNYELVVGITETIPIRVPPGVSVDRSKIPQFMQELVSGSEGRQKLAEMFHEIERTEQRRLQSLMLHNANQATADSPFSISAGMEKGTKNRYNNIWPYDHARVKLNQCSEGECDYINASFLQAKGCDRRYIVTQGPLPATYNDFWRVIWEQNSRVIVMLTKEEEAGRIQCHRYWSQCTNTPCIYGSLSLLLLSETTPFVTSSGSPDTSIIVRRFALQDAKSPSAPPREITQLHFLGWPDFGIPESPCQIMKLIEGANGIQAQAAQTEVVGPMVVHCSAGCGRSGAFCTIDSVLMMLRNAEELDLSKDIIRHIVESFREQRLSMVQTLRQYVFCYEAILWKLVGSA